jgi:hypothetical protein
MSEQLVAITRQDGSLSAIVSRVVVEGEKPPDYRLAEVGVAAVRDARARAALAAWRCVDEVRLGDARSVASSIEVLLATVPVGARAAGAAPERGHAWLCQPSAWPALRAELRARPQVAALLRADGWGQAVERLAEARDPYLAYHHGGAGAVGSLPRRFVACLLPRLRGRAWIEVRRTLSHYWSLGLERHDGRLALVVRLLAGPHGLGWLDRAAMAPGERQDALLTRLLAGSASAIAPATLPGRLFDGYGLDDSEGDGDRIAHLLRRMGDGVPAEEALQEIQFAAAFAPSYRFEIRGRRPVARRHPRLPARHAGDLSRVLERLRDAGTLEDRPTFAARLWRWSVSRPDRAAVLARPSLVSWPPDTACAVLDALMLRGSREWSVGARAFGFEDLLRRVPVSHHERAVEEAACVLEHVPAGTTARAMALVARLARPPYRARLQDPGAAALLALAAGDRGERLQDLADRTLQRLDRALAEDHGIQPLRAGLRAVAQRAPRLFWDALAAHPEPLMAAARDLGLLHPARRRVVLRRFRAHPVAQRRFARRPLDAVCAAIERAVALGLPSPIPRRLRDHRAGVRTLSSGSLERHRQAIVRRLLPFRLALLRLAALDDVRRGVPADLRDEGERHAVLMLAGVTDNKRLLRRVLRLPAAARARFLAEHPRNRAWAARHPAALHPAWSGGDALRAGTLRLALERDPLEVLRIGTRVGSCLALGGCHDDAAVSTMADDNKRVVLARDERGAFVARQRIAITEDDRLLCSPVYPQGAETAVADAFRAYDVRLAERLGVKLVRPGEDYDVAEVLARADYDDGVWSRLADTG